jgi:Kef-type K+ transport system membrane component KefB
MVGAFLSGVVLDSDMVRPATDGHPPPHHVLLILMPVFFLSTGLKTDLERRGERRCSSPRRVARRRGRRKAARGAHRRPDPATGAEGEASIIGWLLQTKALIMIIFANILMDVQMITSETFTALLLMAVVSTMLTVPMVSPKLARMRARLPEHPDGLPLP